MTGTRNLPIALVICSLLLPATRPAAADTHYVAPGGSIQAAINAAGAGDQIEVAPGTYNGAINFNGKAVRLYSSGGPGATTINGAGADHVVQCVSGEGAATVLEGFTITGGNANGASSPDNCGGGMLNRNGSSPTVIHCTFSANTAAGSGGGMYNTDGSSPTVTNCTFMGNRAVTYHGGGMYSRVGSNPTVTGCIFTGNEAGSYGGGMHSSACSPTVTNCTFTGNSAGDGGGMSNYQSSPTVTNCTITSNGAPYGGGLYNYQSSPAITNCTFTENWGGTSGGGAMYNDGGNPGITNCILWGDTGGEIHGPATVNYSDVQGGWTGTGNINADPLFADAAGRLAAGSPCIDAGSNAALPEGVTTDLDGNGRILNATVDMGAYEFLAIQVIHNVTQDHWYETIQSAIDHSIPGDQIEVDPGTYDEAINFSGKAIRLYSSGGPGATTINATGLDSSVVTCQSSEGANTILEGFTITGGNGVNGGGMYNTGSSPTVINCTLSANTATGSGGGMYNADGSSPTVTNCTFTGNTAVANNGGGMYSRVDSNPTVTGCIFTTNHAGSYGGGMHSSGCTPTVTNCTFIGNTAVTWGGGMCDYASSPAVTNCTFSGNSAQYGGGVYNYQSSPTVTNCTFNSNSADLCGGGVYNSQSSPAITDCTFTGNWADYAGGMYNGNASSPPVTNCTFTDNMAAIFGGAMYNVQSSPGITNCTFTRNSAPSGGVMSNAGDSSPTITNCILWGDTGGEIEGYARVNYSDVMGGWGWAGIGNINANPMFADAAGRLSPGSPCIDAGNNDAVPAGVTTDLDGNGRIFNATVDMGAYEFLTIQAIHNVTQDHWYGTIQSAIDNSSAGDQIEVGPGTYHEAINFHGKAIRLYSSDGPGATTIDGTGKGYHVVQCVSGEGAGTVLEGFTITGGHANGASDPDNCGGGMLNGNSSSPTVIHCSFSGNSAHLHGGGMYNYNSSAASVTNCTFTGNTAASRGGGMCAYASSPTVTNCTFTGNSAGYGGGMSNVSGSNPTVTNCTFTLNSGVDGGAMHNYYSSGATITNCILWGDTPAEIWGPATVSYSDIQGGWTGTGNINANPMFADAAGRLSPGSPCVNAGNDDAVPAGVTTDLDGNPRIVNGAVDMGAYERRSPTLYVPGDYSTIQDAIEAAVPGEEIEVAQGTYQEAINFLGKAIRLYSADGPAATIIDGTGAGYHVVQCVRGEGAGTVLEGFTIAGGNANGASSPDNCGGGMLNGDSSSPTVINCTFSANTAASSGGGMYNTDGSSPTVTNCTFTGNRAVTYHGGGMYSRVESNPTVTGCIFTNNEAGSYGGGMHSSACSPTVTNCTFTGNSARLGAGVCNVQSSPAITNCTFTGNSANSGGGMYNGQSSPVITNCTFNGNTVGSWGNGGGMFNYQGSPVITNCILWGDTGGETDAPYISSATVSYSDVQGGWTGTGTGTGNINANPMFADAARRLSAGSPCIDKGSNAAVPPGVTTDLDGNPRIFHGIVDMGAYESQCVLVAVDDRVVVSLGSTRYDMQTMQTSGQMTITNTSATAIGGPVWVVITSISELAVTLTDATGTTSEGYSYVDVTALLGDGSLAPGEQIALRLAFNNPDRLRFTFTYSIRAVAPPE